MTKEERLELAQRIVRRIGKHVAALTPGEQLIIVRGIMEELDVAPPNGSGHGSRNQFCCRNACRHNRTLHTPGKGCGLCACVEYIAAEQYAHAS